MKHEGFGRLGGGLGFPLSEVRKHIPKLKGGEHAYAVGYKWKDRKRPDWFKNPAVGRSGKEIIERLNKQYSISKDNLCVRKLK